MASHRLSVRSAAAICTWLAFVLAPGQAREFSAVLEERYATIRHNAGVPKDPQYKQAPANEPFPSKCANKHWTEKLVVAARHSEDVSWMAESLVPWLPFLVYSSADSQNATHKTLSNTGREAQAYLQFIVDYYDCLPKEVAFIHGHRFSQHSSDILLDLRRLKWGSIPGHVGLSRPQHTNPFFLENPDLHLPAPDVDPETAHWMRFARSQTLNILVAWPEIFQAQLGPPPERIHAPCCGQFVTTRKNILRLPRHFYEGCLRWLQHTSHDYFWAGLVFEHVWAYVIGGLQHYVHPEECEVFACSRNGSPVTPAWEALRGSVRLRACHRAR